MTFRVLTATLWLAALASQSLAQAPAIRINELLASNVTGIRDAFGSRSDWIEIHNSTASDVNLAGYFLSDAKATPQKWTFPAFVVPAGGYRVVFASNRNTLINGEAHTNFALSRDGEFLQITAPDGSVVDSVTFGYQETDYSFGRDPSDPSAWMTFTSPTPGAMNAISVPTMAEMPVLSVPGGFHSGPVVLTMTPADPADAIRYTTDGTVPTVSSPLYVGPLTLEQTTAVRAASFRDGVDPSRTVTRTYLVDEPVNMPVFSIVTDPAGLFSDADGIYVRGTNGIPGKCDPTPRNVNQDWEREIHLEMYETDGTRALSQGAGLKIMGGCSRTRYPQKSFSLHARSVYGAGSFRYPLFPDRPMTQYQTFNLRAAADDQVGTFFRDPFTQHLTIGHMDADRGAFRPAVVYINGAYWGIHNLRERQNDHYIVGNFGVARESIDLLDNNAVVKDGSNTDFLALRAFIEQNDLSDPANMARVASEMDVDQFLEHHLANIYTAEEDWPGNNISFWRSSEPGHDRWRWIQFDRDHSFKSTQTTVNNLELALASECGGCAWPNPPWSTIILRKLLTNTEIRNRFIQLYAFHLNTTYDTDRVLAVVDSFEARFEAEMPRHIQRWGGQRVPDLNETNQWVPPTFSTMEEWRSNIEGIRTFARNRPAVAVDHLRTRFGLNTRALLRAEANDWTMGAVRFHHKRLHPGNAEGRYFKFVPIILAADPAEGHSFSHWTVTVGTTETTHLTDSLQISLTNDTVVRAYFQVGTSVEAPEAPLATALLGNWPNPFNPATVIGFQLSVASRARLSVYDVLGREVAVLVDGMMDVGEHRVRFDADRLSSGVYLYRLQVGSEVFTKRMTLLK